MESRTVHPSAFLRPWTWSFRAWARSHHHSQRSHRARAGRDAAAAHQLVQLLSVFAKQFLVLAQVGQHLGVFHVVAIPATLGVVALRSGAVLVESVDQVVVALHFLHIILVSLELLLAALLVDVGAGLGCDALEDGVISLAALHDLHQLLPGRLLVLSCSIVPCPERLVHIDVARVHGAAGNVHGFCGRQGLHVTNGLVLEGLVAEAAHVALVGQLGDLLDLGAESLGGILAEIIILHPVHGEQIAQARSNGFALHHRFITAVGAPRRLLGIGGSDCQDLAIRSEIWEHGAALAGFHVEDQLLEHLLALHGLQGLGELLHVQHRAIGEGHQTHTTVVDEVHEDGVLLGALEHLALGSLGVAGQHVHEELGGHLLATVVHLAALVDIWGVIARLVVQLSLERVLGVVRNIILHHEDNVLSWDATLHHELVCMAAVSLVSVVPEAGGSCSDDRPLLSRSHWEEQREGQAKHRGARGVSDAVARSMLEAKIA
mmetsp:Transcript_60792/g.133165  ORF Transcript_60792/g.133165 Transcript_60792/m.133165 type:complete len:489 (-) Transcript_60792:7-1473(-)